MSAKLRRTILDLKAELASQSRWANEYFRSCEKLNAENKQLRKLIQAARQLIWEHHASVWMLHDRCPHCAKGKKLLDAMERLA